MMTYQGTPGKAIKPILMSYGVWPRAQGDWQSFIFPERMSDVCGDMQIVLKRQKDLI